MGPLGCSSLVLAVAVEHNSKAAAADVVENLVDIVDIDSVLVEFSGPNMPNILVGKELDFLTGVNSKSTGGLISAKATFKLCEYHETTDSSDTTTTTASAAAAADLVIAFNAGIWGYDSWKPTIKSMIGKAEDKSCSWRIGETLFVITAYTKEECEDDADVIAEVVEEAAKSSSKKTESFIVVATTCHVLFSKDAHSVLRPSNSNSKVVSASEIVTQAVVSKPLSIVMLLVST